MARPKKTDEGTGKPISIRLSDQYQSQLEMAAKRLDLPVSEVMRLCLRIGMEHFSRIDYNTAKCIVDAVENQKAPPQALPPPPEPEPKEKLTGKKNRFVVKELIVPERSTTLLNEGATDAQREIESLQRRLDELAKETGSKTK